MGHQKSAEAIVGGDAEGPNIEVPRVGGGVTCESMRAEANRTDEAYVNKAGRSLAELA